MLGCAGLEIMGRKQFHFLPSLDQGTNFAESVESELIRLDGSPLPVLINSLRLTVHAHPMNRAASRKQFPMSYNLPFSCGFRLVLHIGCNAPRLRY